MHVQRHATIAEFLSAAGSLLHSQVAENHLLLGLCSDMAHSDPAAISPVLLTVSEGAAPLAAALRTPPRKLILTGGPAPAMEALAGYAAEHAADLPGVHGPGNTAAQFAASFAQLTATKASDDRRQRVFQCHQVRLPRTTPGVLRLATADDTPLLAEWVPAFIREVDHPPEDPLPLIERKLARREIFLWDDGGPVSTASIAGQDSRLARVLLVYTPSEYRGRGYASACVAALTQRMLNDGNECFLYTDAANPIPNHVYQRIGYEHVCEFGNWKFEPLELKL